MELDLSKSALSDLNLTYVVEALMVLDQIVMKP